MILRDLYQAFVDGREVEKLRVVKGRVLDSALELITSEDFDACCGYMDHLNTKQKEFDHRYQNASCLGRFVYDLGQWFN